MIQCIQCEILKGKIDSLQSELIVTNSELRESDSALSAVQSKLDDLGDTLWVISNFDRTRGYPTGPEWTELIKLVNESLKVKR